MRKVLVVGGAGYIGGAVTDALLEKKNSSIRVYDKLLYDESFRKPVDFVYGDILDTALLKPHLRWADTVIWLAAIVGDGACRLDEILTIEVNQKAVQWLSQNYKGRIIFTSTCSVYGAQKDTYLDESSPLDPLSLYAVTKLRSEAYLENRNALVLRLGTVFGVSDEFARLRMDLVVNTMTVRACETNKITVFGGDQYRPLIHVKDIGRMVADQAGGRSRGVYNLSSFNMTMMELARRIHRHFPKTRIVKDDMIMQDNRDYKVSTKKVERDLRYKPQYSLDDGILELAGIISSRRIKNYNNPRYHNAMFLKETLK
jgi:nucleoside-diphosphate-sugar epimerase